MHTLYPPPAPGGDDDDNNFLSQELKNNFDAVRTLLASSSSNNKEEVQNMATKTAIRATDEIARLQNGIAELEALLAAQQDDDVELPMVVEFPSLPPVVVEEEEEDTASKQQGKGEQPLVRG